MLKKVTLTLIISLTCFGCISQDSTSINKKRLTTVIIAESAFYVGGISFLSFVWYKDHKRVPLHYYNDNRGWLQLDKAGHMYSAYHESYAFHRALRWSGVSRKKALWYSAPMGLILQTPIEVFDGLYEGYGFSWGDMAANAAGPVLFAVQELAWQDQIIQMKFSYSPSGYPKYRPGTLGETELESFFTDYNGHTYWLSANLNRLVLKRKIPDWLNIAVGYSGNGMLGEFENPEYYRGKPLPRFDRYRQYLFSLDVDFSKINTKHGGLRTLFQLLNLIKIPAPALEFTEKSELKFRAIYF